MAMSEREREHRPEHSCRDATEPDPSRDRELDAILMERAGRVQRFERMDVSPDGKRTTHLFVAESPASNVAVVTHHQTDPGWADANRERDASAVADTTLLLLYPDQRRRGQGGERS